MTLILKYVYVSLFKFIDCWLELLEYFEQQMLSESFAKFKEHWEDRVVHFNDGQEHFDWDLRGMQGKRTDFSFKGLFQLEFIVIC